MQLNKKVLKALRKKDRAVKLEELRGDADLKKISKKELERTVRVLLEEGKVKETAKGFVPVIVEFEIGGVFQSSTRGYGFVKTETGDYFIPPRMASGAMNGDEVIITGLKRKGPGGVPGARVAKVTKRANKTIVGRLNRRYNLSTVVPVNKRLLHEIVVPPSLEGNAGTGDIVVVEIDIWPENRRPPQGHVIRILGKEGTPGVDIETVIHGFGLPDKFSAGAIKESNKLNGSMIDEELAGRRDLRTIFTVTIDGLDAKDFDDAVSLDVDGKGFFNLTVHIADVSHYVKFGGAIDRDAFARGTSVYLPDRVLPMLPERLSNDICSLKPNEDRLAFSVSMRIDQDGEVRGLEIFESIIRSDLRLTYEEVDDYLSSDRFPNGGTEKLIKSLNLLSAVLTKKRVARGGLEFETIEPKIILDEDGWPVEIKIRERTAATQIIEEAMIATNESIARFMWEKDFPMVYRIHERPDPEAIIGITEILKELNYPIGSLEEAHSRTFQALIDYAHDRPEKHLINSLLLRAMRQARYAAALHAHFGLASEHYTHFTSPIRRYPDLVVHRLVKATLQKSVGAGLQGMVDDLTGIAEQCSVRERVAVDAEREAVDIKLCQYMSSEVGKTYNGVVSGVSAFGLFVRVPNSAEGLIHIRQLSDDYYHFDPVRYLLVGERSKRTFRLGQHVKVRLIDVSIPKRELDFILEET